MDLALALTTFLMGLAGAPHCTAMCGPACAAAIGPQGGRHLGVAELQFHLARVLGYATAGALAAAGVGLLSWAGQTSALIRPVWTLLHVAALALGLWLAFTGRQPDWMARWGTSRTTSPAAEAAPGVVTMRVIPMTPERTTAVTPPRPLRAILAGAAWVAWPCGLLQSALVVAGLANTPLAGGAAMAAFAMASALGLQLGPWLWWQGVRPGAGSFRTADLSHFLIRVAGALLAAGSVWALGRDRWGPIWAYCVG